MSLDITRAPTIGVPHGFFGRAGGRSTGAVAGLNCGFGAEDDPETVRANRRLAADAIIEGAPLASVHQVHSADAVVADTAWPIDQRPHADALATATPGLVLGIVTADCAPILLADEEAGVIAAAHAGWRGAVGGVTDAAIGAMLSLGAKVERISAAVGPCLAQRNFEVGYDFPDAILAEDPDNERFFIEGPSGQPHFDLEAYVAARLAAAGIGRVWTAGLDTYALSERYYSYRRATHEGAPTYGRQVSMIGLPGQPR